MTWQKYIREYLQCLVQLLIGLPVHDESVRDDHLLQIILIMSGDTEKVQLVALLIISDLEQDKPSLQLSTKKNNGWNRQSTKMHLITVKPFSPLNHLFIPHTRDWCFGGRGCIKYRLESSCHLPSIKTGLQYVEHNRTLASEEVIKNSKHESLQLHL